jgi:hypothetical protein
MESSSVDAKKMHATNISVKQEKKLEIKGTHMRGTEFYIVLVPAEISTSKICN